MIYTSRYGNPELSSGEYTVVGVTRGKPKFKLKYNLDGNIAEIAPPYYLFNEYDRARFTRSYMSYMDKTGAKKISELLHQYEAKGKPVVLCCFEDVREPKKWCHRQVFAEWWMLRTGEEIKELQDPTEDKWKMKYEKAEAKAEPEAENPEQLRMW